MNKIKRAKRNTPFVMIDKTALKDKNLTWKAKGLLAYLLSLPDDWSIYIDEIKNHSKDGKDSTASGIKELINAGYIERIRKHNESGQFNGYDYLVLENIKQDTSTINGFSVNGLSVNGFSVNGKSATTNKDNKEKEDKEKDFRATPKNATEPFKKSDSAKGKTLETKAFEKSVNKFFLQLREQAAKVGNIDNIKNDFLLHCQEVGFQYKSNYALKAYIGDYLSRRAQEEKVIEKVEAIKDKSSKTPSERLGAMQYKLFCEVKDATNFNFITTDWGVILRWLEYLKEVNKPIHVASTMQLLFENVQKVGISKFSALCKYSKEGQYNRIYWDKEIVQEQKNYHPPIFNYDR